MTEQELYYYRMNGFENEVLNRLYTKVLIDSRTMGIPSEYENTIHRLMKACRYSASDGYYYIAEGDRGQKSLRCHSHDSEDMRWFILEQTAKEAGQRLELLQRKDDEKNWRWIRRYNDDGKRDDIEQTGYIYNAVNDSRKFWMEYEIRALSRVFSGVKLNELVRSYVDSLNYWFEAPHWGFDYEKLCFIEISDSREKE